MKRIVAIACCLLLLLNFSAKAQGGFEERFRSFQRQNVEEFSRFNQECNKQYIDFLKEARTRFSSEQPVPFPDDEDIPPVVLDTAIEVVDNEIEIEIEIEPMVDEDRVLLPSIQPDNKVVPPTPDPILGEDVFRFDFYGTELGVRAGDDIRFYLSDCNGSSLSAIWKQLTNSSSGETLEDLESIRADRALCDWAWLQLLHAFAESYYGKSDEAGLMTAFLLCQSGYAMRLGVQDKHLVVLFSSPYLIYDKPYYRIAGRMFFSLNGDGGDIDISDFAFPNEKAVSLAVTAVPQLTPLSSETRTLSSTSDWSVQSKVNRNLLDFYNDYPESQYGNDIMTRWALLANTPVSTSVRESLYPQFQSRISAMSEYQAVSSLLEFMQKAFEYEYDDKVWGRDRSFFVEETLYYPYADCEDRAILFSRFVRDLVGLDVALVYYPGHLTAAVSFSSSIEGDYILLNNRKFTICDPTYIGAPVGATMPSVNHNSAKAVLLAK